ncbi:MAG: FAD-dependent monooxygenase [Phycisphaera sp.]|nr:MAG: FAD-dependent monooxygenase [Phycisphaera sp.]
MAKTPANTHVVIAGAGLVGALLAIQLGRRGYKVTLCERRPDPRTNGFIGGRSINLALSCRGITALERVGLADRVLADAIRMPGRMLHDEAGNLTFQAYSSNPEDAIHSVSRGGLNVTLLEALAEYDNVVMLFEHRCVGADLDAPAIEVEITGGESKRIEADYVIGCDGAFSAVRAVMQTQNRFNYSQQYLDHGYKELTIPPASECGVDPALHNGFAMDPNALHIWPRGHYMMIALPNADRTFTCTLFWPFEGSESFDEISSESAVLPFFEKHFADAVPLMPTLIEDYTKNPIGSLVTVRCSPWHKFGNTVLLGDAAHAIVPFYGQGMNSGFEDCRVLGELIDEHDGDFGEVIREFSKRRIPNANAIADLALDNFIEMRDSVANQMFLLRKRIEHALHAIDAERYMPLYNLVSFSNMPYADAQEVGSKVVRLAQNIADAIGLESGQTMSDAELSRVVAEYISKD